MYLWSSLIKAGADGLEAILGFVPGCPWGHIDIFLFFFSPVLSERACMAKKSWCVCYVSSHMIFLSPTRRRTASLGVRLCRARSPRRAGSHSGLPGWLKMSLPV